MLPPLDPARLTEALVAQGPFAGVTVVGRTGSTNADLLEAAATAPHLTALVAEHQTLGRGRHHPGEAVPRRWVAPPRSSLLVSVLLRPPSPAPSPPTLLPLAFALAAIRAVDLILPGRLALKWPNDIVAPHPAVQFRQKVGGVLAALAPTGELVIGLGLNVHQTSAQLADISPPDAVRPPAPGRPALADAPEVAGADGGVPADAPATSAASLATLGAPDVDRTWLAIAYLAAAADQSERWARGERGLVDGIVRRMETLGRQVIARLPGGDVIRGTAQRLAGDGALMLVTGSGAIRRVDAAEVV